MAKDDSNSSMIKLAAISGAIVGGLVGAVAGILLAPTSGADTRSRLKTKGAKILKETQKDLEEFKKDTFDPNWEKFRKETLEPNMDKFKDEFQKKFEETKKELIKKYDAVEDKVKETVNSKSKSEK